VFFDPSQGCWHRQSLEKSGESQISLTDPDSRAMAAYTKVGVGYNVQIAVDAKNKMIVEQAVTNDVLDMGLLQQTAEPARRAAAVLTGGRSNTIGLPLRSGTSRSKQSRMAVESPAFAALTTAFMISSRSFSRMASANTADLVREPCALPAGLPLWPFWKPRSCLGAVLSGGTA
jgi:hypothetical protein